MYFKYYNNNISNTREKYKNGIAILNTLKKKKKLKYFGFFKALFLKNFQYLHLDFAQSLQNNLIPNL